MLPGGLRTRKESLASVTTQNTSTTTANARQRAKSPTFSTTTAASDMPFASGVVITRANLRDSIRAYEDLVSAVSSYRGALSTLSHASATLARALEACSRLKGVSDDAACGLQAAGGLHYVISNHEQVLGRTLHLNVEQPLRQHLETYKGAVAERSAAYERTLLERSRIIRQTEKENMNIGYRRQRDLNSFRKTLSILQAQVDDLDRLKGEYYESVLSHEEQIWDFVLNKVAYSVRSTLDVYDRVTSKSSDPNLEPLLLAVPDPFDTYGPPKSEQHIFSILPPLALSMNMTSSPASVPIPLHPGSQYTDSPSSSTSPPSPPFVPPLPPAIPSWLSGSSFTPTSSSGAAPSLISGSAEWADARSASTSPPSIPPPVAPESRPPYPALQNGRGASSKAESKLRTVLSAASEDEGSSTTEKSQDGDVDTDSDSDAGTEVDVGRVQHRASAERASSTDVWRRGPSESTIRGVSNSPPAEPDGSSP